MSFFQSKYSRIRNWFLILGFVLAAQTSFSQCPGFINYINAVFGICDPSTDQFAVTVDVTFLSISPGGILTFEATNASGTYTQTIPGPYVIGNTYTVTIPNIPSDGSAIGVSGYFSNSVGCGLSVTGTSPTTCICLADAGTYSQNIVGSTNSPVPGIYQYELCFNDTLFINPNGDYTPPQDFTVGWTPPPAPVYTPSIYLMQYSCPPTLTPPADMLLDPCFTSVAGNIIGGGIIPNWSGSNQTVYYVPTTMYSTVDNIYAIAINGGDWCYDQGPTYAVTFLSQITGVVSEDCYTGEVDAVITGGMPAFDASNFTVVPGSLVPSTASFTNTTCGNGGTIQISGLVDQDVYSFDVVDSKNCPVTISGTFTGAVTSNFSYPQTAYCLNDVDPIATLAPSTITGGVFTATPVGLSINPITGLIDLSASVAGSYLVNYNNNDGNCPTQVDVPINLNSVPSVTLANQSICAGAIANLAPTAAPLGIYDFIWTVPFGATNPGNVSNFNTSIPGNYDVQIVDTTTGCQSLITSATVSFNPIPAATVNNDSICPGFNAQITATPVMAGGYNYVWTFPAGIADPGNVASFSPNIPGTYSVVITDILTNCSSLPASGTVTILPNPLVNAGPDQIGCDTDVYALNGSGAGVGASYVWTNGVVDGFPFTPVVGVQTYTVTGTTIDGCVGTDDVDIIVDQTPVVSFTYVQIGSCVPTEVVLTNTSNPAGVNCIWTIDNGNVISGCGPITYVFNQPGTFGVDLQVQSLLAGCVSNDYQANIITVESNPIAGFTYSPDELTTLYNEVDFTNTSIGASNYSWDFGDYSAGSNAVDPMHVFTNDGPASYVVTLVATTPAGCIDTARAIIEIADELLIYVPNAFTPDNNEFNRVFQPVFTSGFEPQQYNLLIFNRWGEVILDSKDAEIGWDGTYGSSGGICQDGVYTWRITYRTSDRNERVILTGHVSLIR